MMERKDNLKLLREKAEELLKTPAEVAQPDTNLAGAEYRKIIHELQVHQIELELQNEQLHQAWSLAETANDKYIGLYDLAPSGYFTLSEKGKIIELNLSGARMLGKERLHLINNFFHIFVSEDTKAVFNLFLRTVFSSKTKQTCLAILTTNSNSPLFVNLTGISFENEEQCFVTAVDMTERRQVEIALQQSEAKYRQLAENSTTLVYRILLKPELKFDYVSPSATAITGYTPEDHYNDPQLGFKLVHPDDRILLENTTRYSKGEPLELRWTKKSGQVIWTEQRNVLVFDENHEPYAIEGNARDITDRKNIELGLRKEAERNVLLLGLFAQAPALSDKELYDQALDIAVKITDSKIGFFHQVSDNQLEIILTTWNNEARKNCTSVHDHHYPIERAGNWADCIRQKKPVVYNDFPASPNKKGLPEGHAPVGRTMCIPVVKEGKVMLVFGVGNKASDYTDLDIIQIQSVANDLYKIIEKREVEKNLKKSEDRWQFAIEGSNDGIWDWNLLTGDVFFSNRWKEIIGYGPDDLEKKLSEWQNRVHPDDIEAVMVKLQQHFNRNTPDYISEHRILCRDGSWKWILDRGKVLEWTPDGKPARMVGTHTDITDRKLAGDKLKESEVQYRNLANAGSALLWTSGTDKLCNYFNETWLEFTGRTLEQEMGNGWAEGVHPDDFQRCLETYTSAFDKHLPFEMEYRLRHSSGEYKWILDLGTPNFNSSGEFVGYIGHCFDISERKNTELSLHESEEKYRSIFESVQEVYFEASMDGTLLEVSPSIEKISKGHFIRDEIIGQSFAEIYANPGDRDLYFSKLIEQKRVNDYELSLRNKDGSIIPVAISSVLSYDAKGNPVKITGILRDITERKNAENALKATLEELNETNLHLEKRVEERTQELRQLSNLQQAILSHAGLAIISTSTEGLIEVFNNAAEEMLGYRAEEVIGKYTPVLFHDPEDLAMQARKLSLAPGEMIPSDFGVFQTILRKSLNQTAEWTYVRKGGEKFPVKLAISSVKDSDGQLLCYIGIAIDITKEKESISALRESEERFHRMFWDHSAVMILVDPETGDIVEANKAAEQFYGFTFNKNPRILISDLNTLSTDQVKEEMENALLQHRNFFVFPHKLATGEIRTVEVHSSPIDVKGTKVLFSVIHDITERKRAEAEIREARNEAEKANHAKSEFLSRMSHELRTPMNSILGFAQLMNMGELTPKQKKGINHILTSGNHLLSLIDEVLEISRIEAGRLVLFPEPVLLGGIITEIMDTFQPLANDRHLKLVYELSPATRLFVMSDRKLLKQVLINLLSNAVKYNTLGGTISVKTEILPQNEAGVVSVRISVTDTGLGIAPEDISKLFVPFERIGAEKTKMEGTGLGLSIVKKIMDAMNGAVGVESEVGHGSRFWIDLPITEEQKSRVHPKGEDEKLTDPKEDVQKSGKTEIAKTRTILYIEDNIANAQLVEEIIEIHRPEIQLITSIFGKPAVELAIGHAPGLILLDLELPDINGSEVLANLYANDKTKSIPVVILTADATQYQVEKLMSGGARKYLTKPLDIIRFLQVLDELI
jgi:PAS domain S-box-containing protein